MCILWYSYIAHLQIIGIIHTVYAWLCTTCLRTFNHCQCHMKTRETTSHSLQRFPALWPWLKVNHSTVDQSRSWKGYPQVWMACCQLLTCVSFHEVSNKFLKLNGDPKESTIAKEQATLMMSLLLCCRKCLWKIAPANLFEKYEHFVSLPLLFVMTNR